MDESPEELRIRLAQIEQALIDERAERAQAQRKNADLRAAVDTWRTRSEERSERIVKLESERDELRTATGWLRSKAGRPPTRNKAGLVAGRTDDTIAPGDPHKRLPSIPSVAIASNASGSLGRIVDEARRMGLLNASLDSADLVVVDPATLTPDEREGVFSWAMEDARRPLVVVDGDDSHDWSSADLTLCGPGCVERDQDCVEHLCLPDTVDVALDTPQSRNQERLAELAAQIPPEMVLKDPSGAPVGIVSQLHAATLGPVASMAAQGFPVAAPESDVLDEGAGVRARRWAWATRDPARALEELLISAEVPFRPVDRRIAGLLVSMRPEHVDLAMREFAEQSYEPKELVVGCHGFDPSIVEQILASNDLDLDVRVIGYSSDASLGSCLNDLASRTTAPLLAKIDDDDHYGPAYLEDSVQAIRYSGASVVGKFTHFTYLEATDTTVLRREGLDERFVDAMIPGPTLVFTRAAWALVGFPDRPRKVDLYFVDGLRAAGFAIYSASRWEWMYRRASEGHTWSADETVFESGSRELWSGWHPERVDL